MNSKVLGIGNVFPNFTKKAVVSLEPGNEFLEMNEGFLTDGTSRWTVFFWWPKDFSSVCPTEIVGFDEEFEEFAKLNARVIGASTDSEFAHLAWRQNHPGLRNLRFPMVADTSKSLSEELGILEPEEKVAYRATFILNEEGIIRWVQVNDMKVGRNVKEILRVLEAIQTEKLTPCGWNPGDEFL